MGHLLVGFSTSDLFRYHIDEYGLCDKEYNFELVFVDAREKRYSAIIGQASIFANRNFLWKMQKQK